jgi:hypothetical protein
MKISPLAVVTSIIAQDNSPFPICIRWETFLDVFDESLTRLYDNQVVHRIKTRSHRSTQSSRSKSHATQQPLAQRFPILCCYQRANFIERLLVLRKRREKKKIFYQLTMFQQLRLLIIKRREKNSFINFTNIICHCRR